MRAAVIHAHGGPEQLVSESNCRETSARRSLEVVAPSSVDRTDGFPRPL